MTPSRAPQFPDSSDPRTWLLTSAASPLGLTLARALLAHGDNVVLGALPSDLDIYSEDHRTREFHTFVREEVEREGWKERCIVTELDGRVVGHCQASVAAASESFGGLDVLCCCTSEGDFPALSGSQDSLVAAIVGTVEELAASRRTLTLVRDQVETNFFGPINMIKAALPSMRERRSGHIMVLTAITSHLGTPGLGIFCASGWALEGFCDSLAYEVAPFNIKVTIVQPHVEINILANNISSAPLLPQYAISSHPGPLARGILGRLLDRIYGPSIDEQEPSERHTRPSRSNRSKVPPSGAYCSLSSMDNITHVPPDLPPPMLNTLLAETVHALTAIGGHDNPPARHIVGFEAVACVKEKLKTVSEELEDFVEISSAVDIHAGEELIAKKL